MDYLYTSLPLLCLLKLCMCVFCHVVFLTLGTHALCAIFCVPVVYLLYFFCLVGLFCCLLKYFPAFGPSPCSSSVPSLNAPWQNSNSKNGFSREASQCPPGRPENWGLCQGLHASGSPVGYGKDLPHDHLLARHGQALQILDALLGPREVAGGLHQSGSEFERLKLQGGDSCGARSSPWSHRVRSRVHSGLGAHRVCSGPGAHRVRSRAHSGPGAHRVRSCPGGYRIRSCPGANRVPSGPGAHRVRT